MRKFLPIFNELILEEDIGDPWGPDREPTFAERLRPLLPDVYLLEDTTGDLWVFLQLVGVDLEGGYGYGYRYGYRYAYDAGPSGRRSRWRRGGRRSDRSVLEKAETT